MSDERLEPFEDHPDDPQDVWREVQAETSLGIVRTGAIRETMLLSETLPIRPQLIVLARLGVNLRGRDNQDASYIATLPRGTTVTILGRSTTGWYHVSYQQQVGWTTFDPTYVLVWGDATSIPRINTPEPEAPTVVPTIMILPTQPGMESPAIVETSAPPTEPTATTEPTETTQPPKNN